MELQQQCRCLISPTANSLLTTANACVVNTKQLNFSRITTLVPVKAGRNSDTEANAAVTSKVTVMTNEDPTTAYYQRDFANVAKTEMIQRTSDEVATNNESDDYRSFLKQEESLNAAQDISVDQLSSNGFSDSDEELDTATDNEPMEVEYDTSDPEWDPSQEIEPKRMQPTPPAGSKDEVVLNASGSSGRRPGDVQRKPPLPRIFKSNKHSEEERSPGRLKNENAPEGEVASLNPKPLSNSTSSVFALECKNETMVLPLLSNSHSTPQNGMITAPTGGDQQQQKSSGSSGQQAATDPSNVKFVLHQESSESEPARLQRVSTSRIFQENVCECQNHHHTASKPVWILCHNTMKSLAKEIVRCCVEWQKNAAREWNAHDVRKIEYKDIIQWDTFPDGFPNLFIKDVKEMAGKDIIFLASMHSVDILFEQLSMMYALPRYLAHSVTVIIPYFPTGTMERVDLEGQIATARTLAQQVSLIPLTARGPCQIMIFDIHALQERFYFSNTVIPRMETAIPLLIKELEQRFNATELSNLMIAYPDEGAQKRFGRFFTKWPEIICSKTRVGAKREIRIRDGDPKGKHVVIVDDLVQTGGTLIEAMKVLYNAGSTAVSAYVTHPVFPKSSWRRFIATENEGKPLLANFWITDSIPHAVDIAQHPPFKLLSLAPVIADSLLGFELRQWDH